MAEQDPISPVESTLRFRDRKLLGALPLSVSCSCTWTPSQPF